MNSFKGLLLLVLLGGVSRSFAQDDLFRVKVGLGLATYFGDLKEKAKPINQSSAAFSIGVSYDITDQIIGKLDFGLLKLRGDDRFNNRIDFINRNLSFQTNIWEINLGVEYDFLNMKNEDYILSPYISLGLGIFHFNPWAYNRAGEKVYLNPLGTEGQGLPSYPDRKPYKLLQLQIPIGAGIKFALNENINAFFDVSLRKIFTDYIDDVGNTYPDKNAILSESPNGAATIALTYRGDELTNLPYPSTSLNRGGYTKDIYYTLGVGISVRLNNFSIGSGGGGGGGGSKRIGRIGSRSSRLRNPRSVF
ncbi:MAG: hypothetical protein EAZ13_09460 [Sphingobacteriia bacterium]|nr:MAG: hypothetical protein EAZ35_09715 [Sphingobacteriia bacterium]TAH06476.1 MAG: hypothetical protein EAZ13_09460 [Sphingobacteriia bacterium]